MSSANQTKLPDGRSDWASIEELMTSARGDDVPWRGPRTFKPAYFAGDDVVGGSCEPCLPDVHHG